MVVVPAETISTLAPGRVLPIPKLPLASNRALSLPAVAKPKISEPLPKIPVLVSLEKVKAGEAAEPLDAKWTLLELMTVVAPT